MSQLSSLSNVCLITSRSDVISFFKKSLGYGDFLSVCSDISSIWVKTRSIKIIDVSILEKSPPIIFVKLLRQRFPILFLEVNSISEKLKMFIEDHFQYVIPFPLGASVLKNYLKNISSIINERSSNYVLGQSLELTNTASFFGYFVGNSKAIKMIRTQFERVAQNEAPVLLMGETGTGKTTGAEVIHKLSKRGKREMAKLSMSTVVETLAVSTFFGTVTGAYTDATAKKGLFKMADKSSLFLDEIGLASPFVQGLLLNVLNSGEIQRVGSDIIEKVDIRLITATNENLQSLVKNGNFRSDLFYRINDNIIKMPALRDRKEDLPEIVTAHLSGKTRTLSENAMDKIMQYDWPGNIRQLHKCLDRAFNFYDKEIITADELDFDI